MELKPCPFCGGEAEYFEERIFIMNNAFLMGVKCKKCGGAYFDADKLHCPNDAFRAWNNRAFGMTVNQYGDNGKVIGRVENLIYNLDSVEDGEAKRYARAAIRVLERLKQSDVRPVVLCRDCYAYRKDKELARAASLNPEEYCALLRTEMAEDGFCSYGKRREARTD